MLAAAWLRTGDCYFRRDSWHGWRPRPGTKSALGAGRAA
jgi:hypothetical protein